MMWWPWLLIQANPPFPCDPSSPQLLAFAASQNHSGLNSVIIIRMKDGQGYTCYPVLLHLHSTLALGIWAMDGKSRWYTLRLE